MEKRSLVLTALLLAFLGAGVLFYGLGRQAGVLPTALSTRATDAPEVEQNEDVPAVEGEATATGTLDDSADLRRLVLANENENNGDDMAAGQDTTSSEERDAAVNAALGRDTVRPDPVPTPVPPVPAVRNREAGNVAGASAAAKPVDVSVAGVEDVNTSAETGAMENILLILVGAMIIGGIGIGVSTRG